MIFKYKNIFILHLKQTYIQEYNFIKKSDDYNFFLNALNFKNLKKINLIIAYILELEGNKQALPIQININI